jgi:Uma2 family endonuclease
MAKQTTVPGMVRLDRIQQGCRLRVEREAQKEQDKQCPPVVMDLTRHAAILSLIDRGVPESRIKQRPRMATAQLVSEEEYLHTSYEPDAEYVEGRIVHRSMPQSPHSEMQTYFVYALYTLTRTLGRYRVWDVQRIRTKTNPARYRIPDICVTVGRPNELVFTEPPFLCIEILSPDDSISEHRAKLKEYLAMGVSYIWVIDPVAMDGDIHTADRTEPVRDGIFRAGDIAIDIREANPQP